MTQSLICRALLVACSEYGSDPNLPPLPKTKNDVAALATALRTHCSFADINILENAPSQTVRVEVQRFLSDFVTGEFRLLYFAGHGVRDAHGEFFLALNDSDSTISGTGISGTQLRGFASKGCDKQLLLFDCCNAASVISEAGRDGTDIQRESARIEDFAAPPENNNPVSIDGYGRWVLAASRRVQRAFDQRADGAEIDNGVFTHSLVEGLGSHEAADASHGFVTVDSLYRFIHTRVKAATDGKQEPAFGLLGDTTGTVRLSQPQAPAQPIPAALNTRLSGNDNQQRVIAVTELRLGVESEEPWAEHALARLRQIAAGDDYRPAEREAQLALGMLGETDSTGGEGEPQTKPPRVKWPAIAAAVAALSVGGYWVLDREPEPRWAQDVAHVETLVQEGDLEAAQHQLERATLLPSVERQRLQREIDAETQNLERAKAELEEREKQATAERQAVKTRMRIDAWLQSGDVSAAQEHLDQNTTLSGTDRQRLQTAIEIEKQRKKVAAQLVAKARAEAKAAAERTTAAQRLATEKQQRVDSLLAEASDRLSRKRYSKPAGQSALDSYRAVLAIAPDNSAAQRGIDSVFDYYRQQAEDALVAGRLDSAQAHLDRLAAIAPEHVALAPLQRRLQRFFEDKASTPRLAYEPDMVNIPAGRFDMGCLNDDGNCDDDEKPVRKGVKVAAFRMAKTETTVAQFRAFVDDTNYKTDAETDAGGKEGCWAFKSGEGGEYRAGYSWRSPGYDQGEKHPVLCVSHHDALAYIKWLNRKTKKVYRLPTEAQWEYAARATSSDKYSFGSDPDKLCRHGNVADKTPSPAGSSWSEHADCSDEYWFTAPVASFQANKYGLHDLHGNVWEWTCSSYQSTYNGAEEKCADDGAADKRVLRGGSWNIKPQSLRSATRYRYYPAYRFFNVGFRVAQDTSR